MPGAQIKHTKPTLADRIIVTVGDIGPETVGFDYGS